VSLSTLSQPYHNTLNMTYHDIKIWDLIFTLVISCNFTQIGYMHQ